MPRTRIVRVVGIYQLGLLEFDSQYGLVSLDFGERLHVEGRARPDSDPRPRPLRRARHRRDRSRRTLGAGYDARDWASMNQSLFSALWLEKMGISIAVALIVIVGALNIISSLILMVMQKSRDIAILKTMGASSRSVMAIFIAQGTAIGIVGTAIGGVGGLALCWVLDHYKVVHIPIDVYQVSYVPFIVLPLDFAVVVVSARRSSASCPRSTRHARPRGSIPCRRCGSSEPMPLVHVDRAEQVLHRRAPPGCTCCAISTSTSTQGEMVAVVGASGVGKSTLLHVLGGLDRRRQRRGGSGRAGAGAISTTPAWWRSATARSGSSSSSITCCRSSRRWRTWRCRCASAACRSADARARATELLARVGLAERIEHRPSMLSGGEQQRVAVARALVMRPALLLADEPTGDLDEPTAESLHGLLRQMHAEHGLTSVIATHNPKLAAACDRVLRLEGGQLKPA